MFITYIGRQLTVFSANPLGRTNIFRAKINAKQLTDNNVYALSAKDGAMPSKQFLFNNITKGITKNIDVYPPLQEGANAIIEQRIITFSQGFRRSFNIEMKFTTIKIICNTTASLS